MSRSSRITFLVLVLTQACHSIEEYATRLYDVFAPARFVSGLISEDRRIGFVLFNVSVVAFGLWCFFGPVLRGARFSPKLAWYWAVLELLNGSFHVAWAVSAGAYRPGLATAPILIAIALVLGWQLRSSALRAPA